MVDIMCELQLRRNSSRVFHGKDGFITPRDLFRWADRKPRSYQELAEAGIFRLPPAEREARNGHEDQTQRSGIEERLRHRVVVQNQRMHRRNIHRKRRNTCQQQEQRQARNGPG